MPAPEAFGSDVPLTEEPAPAEEQAEADETPEQRLAELFAELKREASEEAAQRIASRIEREWRSSGSATVDLLMLWAGSAMAKDDHAAALDFLDQALILAPDYSEAWNRRATLHFAMDRLGKSVADIEQVLRREPRHFGALLGLATILERTDRKDEALDVYLRVLDIYPALGSAQDAVARLSEELTGQAI